MLSIQLDEQHLNLRGQGLVRGHCFSSVFHGVEYFMGRTRNAWNCLSSLLWFIFQMMWFPEFYSFTKSVSQHPCQYPSWQTLPDYNWLSFAITCTTLFKGQMLIRITIPKMVPIKNLPVVKEGRGLLCFWLRLNIPDVIFSEAITKLTTTKSLL